MPPSPPSAQPSSRLTPGRLLISLVAVFTSTGCFLADFNDSHVYNPKWMPHAKFHAGQTMSLGLSLGLLSLYHLWWPLSSSSLSPASHVLDRTFTAYLLSVVYWVTQIAANYYPNVQAVDPPAGPEEFPQFRLGMVVLAFSTAGYWLERSRLRVGRK